MAFEFSQSPADTRFRAEASRFAGCQLARCLDRDHARRYHSWAVVYWSEFDVHAREWTETLAWVLVRIMPGFVYGDYILL